MELHVTCSVSEEGARADSPTLKKKASPAHHVFEFENTDNAAALDGVDAGEDRATKALISVFEDKQVEEAQEEEQKAQEHEAEEEAQEQKEETHAQRLEREQRESEAMVWELMRQEAQEAYAMQMEFMRDNEHLLSQEDREALQAAVRESVDPALLAPALPPAASGMQAEDGDQEGDEGDGDGEGNGDEEDDEEEGWDDYDRLLALGEQIGDVKTERWRMDAAKVIAGLPTLSYSEVLANLETTSASASGSASPSSSSAAPTKGDSPTTHEEYPCKRACTRFRDTRCAVCMEAFAPDDRLSLLPCTHYFHGPCAAGWLSSHNSCPCCKAKVVASPIK